jgi:hypothetical protein
MATWREVEKGLANIKGLLSSSPPNVAHALRLVEELAAKVQNRKTAALRVFEGNELKDAVRHIAFETQHFRSYSKVRRDNPELSLSHPTASQAMGYALLLHLRVLIDFFYKPPADDDCHAASFRTVAGFEYQFPASIHTQTPHSIEVSNALNKLLAHFTATRWEKDRPPWKFYDEFAPAVEELIARFESALPDDLRSVYLEKYRFWEQAHPPRLFEPGT